MTLLDHYILTGPASEDGNPIPVDLLTWGEWFEDARHRRVRATHVLPDGRTEDTETLGEEGVWVSTVFLGSDHNYGDEGPPILWESLPKTEDDWLDGLMCRYASLEAAHAGHRRLVDFLVQCVQSGVQLTIDLELPDDEDAS